MLSPFVSMDRLDGKGMNMKKGLVLEGGAMRGIYTLVCWMHFWSRISRWTVSSESLQVRYMDALMCLDSMEEVSATI